MDLVKGIEKGVVNEVLKLRESGVLEVKRRKYCKEIIISCVICC